MAATYKQFLVAPSSSLLADNASLHYVTTTTSFSGATEIIKHLNALQKQVKKKNESVINLIDGQTIIAAEVDTTLEFQTSGGVYLPGIDDNFLFDMVVQLPIMHIVTFDADGKISQIRQQWDQGSLLKQLDIIGKSGRNWPIKDSKAQLALIQSCLKSSGHESAQNQSRNEVPVKTRGSSIPNAMRDPHASLHLFASREEIDAMEPLQVASPYAGQRPKQRAPTDILTDEPHYQDTDAYRQSPSKAGLREPQPMRIFDGQEYPESDEEDEKPKEKPTHIRAHPLKYEHFDFDDSPDGQSAAKPTSNVAQRPKSMHSSQWTFDDFTTPVKSIPVRGMRKQDTYDWDAQDSNETADSPTAAKQKNGASNGGLYKSNIFGATEESAPLGRALGNITNIKDRGKELESHFTLADESPARPPQSKNVSENRMKAVKMMNANWATSDESPQKENWTQNSKSQQDTHIHISGDGMGGKKGTGRDFLYGEVNEMKSHQINGRKTQTVSPGNFWDF
ncbi:hypothetical protein PT974_09048 [Cladobotryum mycophilum]|uniref:Uncharacterized protein n=1 Tax=Cladobotryum mycophilum TaxID=491253 RepID=A0ABR0SF85_9HYPO